MDEAQWLKAATDTSSTPICELSVQLSKAGMRLERRTDLGLSFQLPFYRTT
jgi:hypothetical protein